MYFAYAIKDSLLLILTFFLQLYISYRYSSFDMYAVSKEMKYYYLIVLMSLTCATQGSYLLLPSVSGHDKSKLRLLRWLDKDVERINNPHDVLAHAIARGWLTPEMQKEFRLQRDLELHKEMKAERTRRQEAYQETVRRMRERKVLMWHQMSPEQQKQARLQAAMEDAL